MIVAVLCTGESLTVEDVEYCRGKCSVVAVSDAVFMAPWADALVSHDAAWWLAHPEVRFDGPKWTRHPQGLSELGVNHHPFPAGNSGALGVAVARDMGATKIILLGCDLVGSHFFGPHTAGTGSGASYKPLKNPTEERFREMHRHFAQFRKLPVVNCSPVSELTCFRRGVLREEL